ncbi:MAG: PstS family phosphate ABC transporter substrate-binding protein [Spirochaetaceae bacterium]|nr:PstS family phosphate ABC transporter substrate-binding protein [Spirochaetaceae bacterium]
MRTNPIIAAALAAAMALTSMTVLAQVSVDPALSMYEQVQGVSGSLKSVGSDTMNNTMTLWAEGFLGMYPNVRIEIEGKGSSTAPPALIAGSSQFGPMSRQMKAAEVDEFESRYGYPPTSLTAAIDMLAVYANKDNPICEAGLTLQQVDAIFSTNRLLGHESDIRTWGDAGVTDSAWADQPISLYGRNSASGTYGYFKKSVLGNGDYKPSVKEQPGSSSVVQGVASDAPGIGYSGIGYLTADVCAVPVAHDAWSDPIAATAEYAYTGEYPLARFLYVYVNHRPGSDLDPLRREFVRYMFSTEGQEDVIKDGYYPITNRIASEAMEALGI